LSELLPNPLKSRVKTERVKKEDDTFEAKQEAYKSSEQRKTD
jgi:hypothetical protein